jgi:predicted site-specific integrase-resolvase
VRVIEEGWVTVDVAAHAADVDAATLLEWCRAGTIDSFRDRRSPHLRFVRQQEVRQHVSSIKGRPQTSMHTLIASYAGARQRSSEAGISALQGLIRERELAS